jgi:two-component system sensor kinase FixL
LDSVITNAMSMLLCLLLAAVVILAWRMQQKRRENRSLAQHYADVTHAARLALVGEITASVTHEVTQPLSAMLSNVETADLLLRRPNPDIKGVCEILADVRNDALRAHGILQRLRPMLRKRDVHFEPVDLNALVSNILTLISGDAASHQVEVQSFLDPTIPPISADSIHLQQVLLNLLINAMHSMDDDGSALRRLEVRTQRRSPELVQISVLDTGRGIAPENLAKIFQSFFTTKSDGLGLGLSITKSIIKAHGGSIWAENRDTGGAVLSFTLPVKGA